MPYLNLHRTNGATDLVDPIVALDNNWDQIDSKFKLMDSGSSPVGTGVVNPETGMQFSASGLATPDIGAFNGATYDKINVVETWGAWQTLTLSGSFTATSRLPRLRVSNLGHVQCRGAVQFQTGTTAWPAGYNIINTNQFAGAQFAPINANFKNTTAGPITGTTSTSWAYGSVHISTNGFLLIEMEYIGAIAASGNYLDFAGLNWDIN